jgi:uncharacterized protein (TIGR03000 family)
MSRLLLSAAVVALLPTTLPAQIPASVASGMGTFGGYRNRPATPSIAAPVGGPLYFPGSVGTRGGFASPFYFNRGLGGGFGGGYSYSPFVDQFYGPFTAYSGGYLPYYGSPGPVVEEPIVVDVVPTTPARIVELSNEFPASLTMEFPAAAKVWLDGQPVAGEAGKERVLTSPVLKPGEKYTFKVRAEWDANGKTYEYTREVSAGPGDRSKLTVLSGTPVSGK